MEEKNTTALPKEKKNTAVLPDMEGKRNAAAIYGTIVTPFYLGQETRDGLCYMTYVSAKRLSGTEDVIPVMVPAGLLPDIIQDETGRTVYVKGMFRSRNRKYGGKSHLDLFLYAESLAFDAAAPDMDGNNRIALNGFLCKKPIFRITPRDRRVTELFIAVNRPDRLSDYIPCITWGSDAGFAKGLSVGDQVRIDGRMQSRCYMKKTEDGEFEKRIAYEISCRFLHLERKKEEAAV